MTDHIEEWDTVSDLVKRTWKEKYEQQFRDTEAWALALMDEAHQNMTDRLRESGKNS